MCDSSVSKTQVNTHRGKALIMLSRLKKYHSTNLQTSIDASSRGKIKGFTGSGCKGTTLKGTVWYGAKYVRKNILSENF
jgi:hypothetical protein